MIDSVQMAVAISTAVAFPVVSMKWFKFDAGWSWLLAIVGANVTTHIVPFVVHPDRHLGSTYSIAILMYFVLILVVSSSALAVTAKLEGKL